MFDFLYPTRSLLLAKELERSHCDYIDSLREDVTKTKIFFKEITKTLNKEIKVVEDETIR